MVSGQTRFKPVFKPVRKRVLGGRDKPARKPTFCSKIDLKTVFLLHMAGLRAALPRPPKAGLRTGLTTGLKRVCLDTINRVLNGILPQTAKPRWTGTFPPQGYTQHQLLADRVTVGALIPHNWCFGKTTQLPGIKEP